MHIEILAQTLWEADLLTVVFLWNSFHLQPYIIKSKYYFRKLFIFVLFFSIPWSVVCLFICNPVGFLHYCLYYILCLHFILINIIYHLFIYLGVCKTLVRVKVMQNGILRGLVLLGPYSFAEVLVPPESCWTAKGHCKQFHELTTGIQSLPGGERPTKRPPFYWNL